MPTLDYFKTHPLRVPKNQRNLTIGALIAAELSTVVTPELHPTAGAFIHYGGVELADMLTICKPNMTPEDLKVMTYLWYKSCGLVAKQLLFYVWRIITKELRHGSSAHCSKAFANGQFHPEAVALCQEVCSGGNYATALLGHPTLPAALYVDAVEQHFRQGGWGGAYGGKKWADIALVFKRYLDGDTSAMIAADRAWTLMHNTGPIFNKGFYFHYHDNNLIKVLNAQATTSVFSLGQGFLTSDTDYEHPTSVCFTSFAIRATEAIQTIKPDYQPGSGGAVNSDGSKGVQTSWGASQDTPGKTSKSIGPFEIYTTADRDEVQ